MASIRLGLLKSSKKRRPDPPATFVYVIGEEWADICKIGVAADPQARLENLQVGNCRTLILHFSMNAGPVRWRAYQIEADAHKHFDKFRIIGEWFDVPAAEVTKFLSKFAAGTP